MIALAGCSTPSSSSSATTPAAARPPAAGQPPGSGPTGYGATDAAWNARHQMDVRGNTVRGAAYDTDPALAAVSGSPTADDRYFAVEHDSGRVDDYQMLIRNLPIGAAGAVARAELPADAREVWTRTVATCAQTEWSSATLARVLGAGGQVLTEFTSDLPSGEPAYDPARVNGIILSPSTSTTAAAAPDC